MGGYATLHFGLHHARRARSITVVGAGYGSDSDKRGQFLKDTEIMAQRFDELGTREAIKIYQIGPARVQLQIKDPRGFREFCGRFAEHSALGSANTLRGVQMRRPTIYRMKRSLRKMKVPALIVSGDEDNNCLEPGIFIKRICPTARLVVFPATGHAVNVEEPDLFNRVVGDFLELVDSGRWRARDPRSQNKSAMASK
jgi:pimeloyl-ACP methyl ester carboxylesterase